MTALLVTSLAVAFLFSYILFQMSKNAREEREKNGDEGVKSNPASIFIRGLCLMVILLSVYTAARVSLDESDYCETVPANATTSGSTVSYEYERVCFENTNATHENFFKMSLTIIIGFIVYVMFTLLYTGYLIAKDMLEQMKNKNG